MPSNILQWKFSVIYNVLSSYENGGNCNKTYKTIYIYSVEIIYFVCLTLGIAFQSTAVVKSGRTLPSFDGTSIRLLWHACVGFHLFEKKIS